MRNEVKSRYTSGRNGNWKLAIGGLGNLVFLICVICGFFVVSPRTALANDVRVTNVSLSNTTPGISATVTFRMSQQNPFGSVVFDGIAFSDYIWVFIKYSTVNGTVGSWNHAILASGGSVTPVSDRLGAFVQSSLAGPGGNNFNVIWNYGTGGNGLPAIDSDTLVKVCAIEMVEIPTGAFWYNAGGIAINSPPNYGGGSEVLIDTTAKHLGATGWPNGYTGLYSAKYEVSQQQYCDYLNSLSTVDAGNRWPAFTTDGYLILSNGTYPTKYTTTAPNRACNFLNWDDVRAYLSWTACRPMTEMEYEKAARGSSVVTVNKRTYPWGDAITPNTLGPVDGGTHYPWYANYGYPAGGRLPILVGWYLGQGYAPANRPYTGASPYGVADLAGNVGEQLINCAWTTVPLNGNGTITGFTSWPTAASGKGEFGGNWINSSPELRVSSRGGAAWTGTFRASGVGCRPARTK